jgi:hypothetical protein
MNPVPVYCKHYLYGGWFWHFMGRGTTTSIDYFFKVFDNNPIIFILERRRA